MIAVEANWKKFFDNRTIVLVLHTKEHVDATSVKQLDFSCNCSLRHVECRKVDGNTGPTGKQMT